MAGGQVDRQPVAAGGQLGLQQLDHRGQPRPLGRDRRHAPHLEGGGRDGPDAGRDDVGLEGGDDLVAATGEAATDISAATAGADVKVTASSFRSAIRSTIRNIGSGSSALDHAIDRHDVDARALALQRVGDHRQRLTVLLYDDAQAGEVTPAQVASTSSKHSESRSPELADAAPAQGPDALRAAGEHLGGADRGDKPVVQPPAPRSRRTTSACRCRWWRRRCRSARR